MVRKKIVAYTKISPLVNLGALPEEQKQKTKKKHRKRLKRTKSNPTREAALQVFDRVILIYLCSQTGHIGKKKILLDVCACVYVMIVF